MSQSLQDQVEQSLRKTGYHPDVAGVAEAKLQETIERIKATGLGQITNEVRALAYDAVLMKEPRFTPRLKFLTRLVGWLGEQPQAQVDVAEDGCGTGVDLFVLQDLLREKVRLTGIDISPESLRLAGERVPQATYLTDFGTDTYDVIYGDNVSIDNNMVWEINTRGKKSFAALRSPGTVLQNADMANPEVFRRLFGSCFARVMAPEILGLIPNNHPYYLYRYEKD